MPAGLAMELIHLHGDSHGWGVASQDTADGVKTELLRLSQELPQ